MRICWGSQYGWCCLAEPQSFSVFFTLFTRGQEKIAFALPFRDGPKHSSSQWGILESLWDNFLECFCYKRNRSRWPLYSCLELECDSATTADTYQPWGGKQMGNQENPRDTLTSLRLMYSKFEKSSPQILTYWIHFVRQPLGIYKG